MKRLKAKKLLNGVIKQKREDLAKMQVDIDYFDDIISRLEKEDKLRTKLKKENEKGDKKDAKKIADMEAKIGKIKRFEGDKQKFKAIFNELVDYILYLENNKDEVIESMLGLL